jgi:hypothetical protein
VVLNQRIRSWLTLRANYRIHRQTGVRFFTIAAVPDAPGFRTSDSDLQAFTSQTVGAAVAVDLPWVGRPGFAAGLHGVHVDLGYEHYFRSNDLRVDVTTCGLGFWF